MQNDNRLQNWILCAILILILLI